MGVFVSRKLELKPELWDQGFRNWTVGAVEEALASLEQSDHKKGNFCLDARTFQQATECTDLELAVLFSTFDEGHPRRRSSLLLLSGLSILSASNVADKAGVLFDLFNFSGSGFLAKYELVLLTQTVVRALSFCEAQRAYGFVTLAHVEDAVELWFGERGTGVQAVSRRDFQRWCVLSSRHADKKRTPKSPARGTFAIVGRPVLGFLADVRGQVGPYDGGDSMRRRLAMYFRAGDKVKVCIGGVGRWYEGTVSSVNADETYDIVYAEGDEDKAVKARWIRHASAPDAPASTKRATSKAHRVPGSHGRGVTGAPPTSGASGAGSGLEPEKARSGRREKMVLSDSDADVLSEGSGDDLNTTSKDRLERRRRPGGSPRKYGSNASPAYSVGQEVKVRYAGRGAWVPAKIVGANRDGTFNVRYANGESDGGLVPEWIKPVDGSVAPKTPPPKGLLKKGGASGNRVRFAGDDDEPDRPSTAASTASASERPTIVVPSPTRSDESGISATDNSKSPASKQSSRKRLPGQFFEGDPVQARLGGRGRWYPGVITQVYDDGLYDVLYEDGDTDKRVLASWIRAASADGDPQADLKERIKAAYHGVSQIGDVVEAKTNSSHPWKRATVLSVNGGGASYDIKFVVDGALHKDVRPEFVRAVSAKALQDEKQQLTQERQQKADMAAEAKRKAEFAAQQAEAARVAADAAAEAVRKAASGSRPVHSASETKTQVSSQPDADVQTSKQPDSDVTKDVGHDLKVGDKILSRLAGRGRWYAGNISAVHADGRVDVEYADGDSDAGLYVPRQVKRWEKPKLKIRKPGDPPAGVAPPRVAVSDSSSSDEE